MNTCECCKTFKLFVQPYKTMAAGNVRLCSSCRKVIMSWSSLCLARQLKESSINIKVEEVK